MPRTINSIAGTGRQGYGGDRGPAQDADLDNPFHVDIDPAGRFLYVADCFNFRVRQVDLRTGTIVTIAGTGIQGHSGDGSPATKAQIDEIYAIQVDSSGNVYLAQRLHPSIRRIQAGTGTITIVAGTGEAGSGKDGIPAVESEMIEPNDCALDGKGGLLIADIQDQRIRRLDLGTGIITTFAGTGVKKHTGDGGLATEADIFGARAVCVDGQGNTYVCEREGNCLRRIDSEGKISTMAGTGEKGYSGDGGPAADALFDGPKALRCDGRDNVLVVDTENHAVRLVEVASGTISTVAGGSPGPHGDGGDPLEAGLARPHGVVTDSAGEIYIADSENHRVRLVR